MDDEFKKDHEWQLYIKGKQDTFEYAFTTLVFAALAFSFQFSPPMGEKWVWALITSWFFLLISGLCGGYRLMMGPQFDKSNRDQLILKKFIETRQIDLQDPQVLYLLNLGRMIDPETGKPHTLEGLEKALADEKSKLAIASKNLETFDKKMPWIFRVQVSSFLFGILVNGTFVAVNHLGTKASHCRKSVTAITDNGGHWNIAPSLIELAHTHNSAKTEETAAVETFEMNNGALTLTI